MIENEKYQSMSDEAVVVLAQQGNETAMEYIVGKYTGFVKRRSAPYFLAGAEREDLVQEGLIGLYKAVKSFNSHFKANFKTFAEVCVVRQMISAVKSSTRKKNSPLNHYVSIHGTEQEEDSGFRYMLLGETNQNPEHIMIERENAEGMESEISRILSDFENEVLNLYLSGLTYKEIAVGLNRSPKAVDNALTRIKQKTERFVTGG